MHHNFMGFPAFPAQAEGRLDFLPGASSMRMALLGEQGGRADKQADALEAQGHVVCRYRCEPELLRDVVRESFDVLLVDDTLRGLRGRSLVLRLKAFPRFDGAVVFVNCSRDEIRLAEALAAGADDFIGSHAGVRELEVRLRAILRRRFMRLPAAVPSLEFGPYRFDPDGRHVYLDGLPIGLTRKEHALALFLFTNAGRLISRGHLLDMIWRVVPRRRRGPSIPTSAASAATCSSIAATASSWWRCMAAAIDSTGASGQPWRRRRCGQQGRVSRLRGCGSRPEWPDCLSWAQTVIRLALRR